MHVTARVRLMVGGRRLSLQLSHLTFTCWLRVCDMLSAQREGHHLPRFSPKACRGHPRPVRSSKEPSSPGSALWFCFNKQFVSPVRKQSRKQTNLSSTFSSFETGNGLHAVLNRVLSGEQPLKILTFYCRTAGGSRTPHTRCIVPLGRCTAAAAQILFYWLI